MKIKAMPKCVLNNLKGIFLILLLLTVLTSCTKKPMKLSEVKLMPGYPSGSALAVWKDKVYLMGDDATYLLVMDLQLNPIDTIKLQEDKGRVAKDIKRDYEAMSVVKHQGKDYLLLMGSGSLQPYRNYLLLLNLEDHHIEETDLSPFFDRIRQAGIKEINIEGLSLAGDRVILSNRGNNAYPFNHLVITGPGFWGDPSSAPIRLVPLTQQGKEFSGVSGLEYSASSHRLFLTVSTEYTYDSYNDGSIGKSYLWVLNNPALSSSKGLPMEGEIYDLEAIDERFIGYKIESVAILSETEMQTELLMVADNDDGGSALFKIVLE